MKARNKHTGAEIVAELVDIVGRHGARDFSRDDKGRLAWESSGDGIVIDWDSASTATDEGGAILIDATGAQVPEADVELFEDDDPA